MSPKLTKIISKYGHIRSMSEYDSTQFSFYKFFQFTWRYEFINKFNLQNVKICHVSDRQIGFALICTHTQTSLCDDIIMQIIHFNTKLRFKKINSKPLLKSNMFKISYRYLFCSRSEFGSIHENTAIWIKNIFHLVEMEKHIFRRCAEYNFIADDEKFYTFFIKKM